MTIFNVIFAMWVLDNGIIYRAHEPLPGMARICHQLMGLIDSYMAQIPTLKRGDALTDVEMSVSDQT